MFYRKDRITLYEKYKLVERTDEEVNVVWKGFVNIIFSTKYQTKVSQIPSAHLLLFFLAFVFGSFCTFCFHMLMYMFDENCVLFPKLMSLSSLRQNIIYEFIPEDKDIADTLPVDFLSTQWVDKSVCLLPTYVPLISGIFGLVWTTMYLMCSVGNRVLTGLQRPWRVLPPVFLFSIVMGGLCVYTSAVTHCGLQELCRKLNEITGSTSCTYTINVATLAYQRRIRGVYQATRLSIASAWLHTACWLLSALLALARVLLAVDFKLVRVSVDLHGNIERMLEHHERQIRTVSPAWAERRVSIPRRSHSSIRIHFLKKRLQPDAVDRNEDGDLIYYTDLPREISEPALVTTERLKLNRVAATLAAPEEHQFIVKMLYNLLDTIDSTEHDEANSGNSSDSSSSEYVLAATPPIMRQYGQQQISSKLSKPESKDLKEITSVDIRRAEEMAKDIKRQLQARFNAEISGLEVIVDDLNRNKTYKSSLTITSESQTAIDKNIVTDIEVDSTKESEPSTSKGRGKTLKPTLKQAGVQTDEKAKEKSHKVRIDSRTDMPESKTSQDEDGQVSKETQSKKEKQD